MHPLCTTFLTGSLMLISATTGCAGDLGRGGPVRGTALASAGAGGDRAPSDKPQKTARNGAEPEKDRKEVNRQAEREPIATHVGYHLFRVDGHLWVFGEGDEALDRFRRGRELAKHVTRVQRTSGGTRILKAPTAETLRGFLYGQPGFVTRVVENRLWVFKEGTEELRAFEQSGELAKHIIRPKQGPDRMTLKAPDAETANAYLYDRSGFATELVDGRLWVFRQNSEALAQFRQAGELAKHVIRPRQGPNGLTIKAPDTEVADAYLYARPGFVTQIEDGRLWVFRHGSAALDAYERNGELAKHIIRPKQGPDGMTLKAPDAETADAYLALLP